MSILHDVQDIAHELDLPIKVRIVKYLHRDLLPPVLLHRGTLDLDIRFLRFTGEGDLLIQPPAKFGLEDPVADGDWEKQEDEEDPVRGPSCSEGDELLEEVWNDKVGYCELDVGEGGIAFGGERSVGNSRAVRPEPISSVRDTYAGGLQTVWLNSGSKYLPRRSCWRRNWRKGMMDHVV